MKNFNDLVNLQKKLDDRIFTKFKLTNVETFYKRKLALSTELSELANEVRCFKFWSVKPPSSRDVILEELVDCLHFLISIGLTLEVKMAHLKIPTNKNLDVVEQFITTQKAVMNLEVDGNNFIETFKQFFILANTLEFNYNEVYEGYLMKNQKNHERQDNNY